MGFEMQLSCLKQSLHIWYVTSSRGILPKLFKRCHCDQNWHSLGELNYIDICLNFFSETAWVNLIQFHGNYFLGDRLAKLLKCFQSGLLHKLVMASKIG